MWIHVRCTDVCRYAVRIVVLLLRPVNQMCEEAFKDFRDNKHSRFAKLSHTLAGIDERRCAVVREDVRLDLAQIVTRRE